MLRKGWLTRLKGGRYLFFPPEYGPENLGENNPLALASAVVEPSYVGWWSVASFHGFTTQKPMTLTVATLRQVPARTVEGNEIHFVKVVARKFFGFKTYDAYGREATISTPAKTLVDAWIDPILLVGLRKSHASPTERPPWFPRRIRDTALQMKSTAALQRLGFLADLVGWQLQPASRQRIREAIPRSTRSIFGRSTRKPGDIGVCQRLGRDCPCQRIGFARQRTANTERPPLMLTTSQLRQSAALSGVRDIGSIEIDVVLTHLLQLFHDHRLTGHLAFKGGTFLP